RELVAAYTRGVNAGIADLETPPFEYLVLRRQPAPWTETDSVLMLHSLFVMLQGSAQRYEADLDALHRCLPAGTYDLMTPVGTPLDAPLDGDPLPWPTVPEPLGTVPAAPPAEIPAGEAGSEGAMGGDEQAALVPGWQRALGVPALRTDALEGLEVAGSNSWVVSGEHTAHGGGMLALDMHMGYTLPNIWYRTVLEWPDAEGVKHRLAGITLPGLPLLVAGSNGDVAWGFTNGRTDSLDLVLLEPDPEDADRYLTPDGPREYEVFEERIEAPGQEPVIEPVRWTIWGPVVDDAVDGHPAAVRWVPHDPHAVNLELSAMETATSAAEALDIGRRAGLPSLNLLVADRQGHIGWTMVGRVPRRVGHDGRLSMPWSSAAVGWDGFLAPEEVPAILDPPSGRLWSSNQRALGGIDDGVLGDGNFGLGARAGQIRDGLMALDSATEKDMLAIQLDDRALFLARWRQVLLDALDPAALEGHPRRAELRRLVEGWEGRAAVDAVGYTLVRDFRLELGARLFAAVAGGCEMPEEDYDYVDDYGQAEGALWALLEARPPEVVAGVDGGWNGFLLAAVDQVIDAVEERGETLAVQTWGERNRLHMTHLFSRIAPGPIRRWLDMAPEPQPGDFYMPRVQSNSYGPSERMVVAPGREAEAIFHMPAGQSAHPMSPHYRDGQEAWLHGEPTSLLPGETRQTLELVPAGEDR
ncbi:MAG: penicillin acylase family protein, partial [Acidobacteria bacterium]|nr:penicillin acylase family protein [Acidobacteriota bacterium]